MSAMHLGAVVADGVEVQIEPALAAVEADLTAPPPEALQQPRGGSCASGRQRNRSSSRRPTRPSGWGGPT